MFKRAFSLSLSVSSPSFSQGGSLQEQQGRQALSHADQHRNVLYVLERQDSQAK